MSEVALILTAAGTLVTALGIAIVAIMTQWQRREIAKQGEILQQVEKQANSRDLESKRVVAMVTGRLADETRREGDIAVAQDAEKVYAEAAIQANKNESALSQKR